MCVCIYFVYIEVGFFKNSVLFYVWWRWNNTFVPWWTYRGHRMILWSQFFPSLFTCVSGIEFRPSGLPDKCFDLLSHLVSPSYFWFWESFIYPKLALNLLCSCCRIGPTHPPASALKCWDCKPSHRAWLSGFLEISTCCVDMYPRLI